MPGTAYRRDPGPRQVQPTDVIQVQPTDVIQAHGRYNGEGLMVGSIWKHLLQDLLQAALTLTLLVSYSILQPSSNPDPNPIPPTLLQAAPYNHPPNDINECPIPIDPAGC